MQRTVALPNGITLEYAERGRASGIPVVFLHGVTDSWRSFEPVMEFLPDTFRAISITQRGHGRSSKPDAGYRYADMAGDLLAFMDALHLDSAIVVGHSMGSLVAQRFAADHPDRVAGLVLVGAFRTLHGSPFVREFLDSTLVSLADPIDPAVAREFQVSTIARPVAPELLETAVSESLQVPARVWRATFKGFLETADFSHELRRVTAPALVVWGDRDAYADRAAQDALAAAIPRARLVTYRGGGHAVHWEDPAAFAHDLVSFALESR